MNCPLKQANVFKIQGNAPQAAFKTEQAAQRAACFFDLYGGLNEV
jgi:hypothetical protein